MTTETPTQKKSFLKRGPIRWEAVIPFTVIVVLFALYIKLFFDAQLRHLGEWGLTKALGAEVDIGDLKTSFLDASIEIKDIEFTNKAKPENNMFQIGDIRFNMSWDALLRAKIYIEDIGVEGIKYGQKRKSPGKVLPEEPEKDKGPSLFATESKKLEKQAVNKLEKDNEDNVFGDIAAMLKGSTTDQQINNLKDQLQSKKMIEDFQATITKKQTEWDQRIKSLPQAAYFNELGKRVAAIKTSNFSSPQEALQNIQTANNLINEINGKIQEIQKTGNDAQADFSNLDKSINDIQKQVKTDIADLEKHFKIPKLDAKAFVMSLVNSYIAPYKGQIDHYYQLAYKYVPPKMLHKKADKQEDPDAKLYQPHEREKGMVYEFGRQNSYPMLWIKKVSVSSDLGKDPHNGNIKGKIENITTSQSLTGKPTTAMLAGDFPAEGVTGFVTNLSFDNRTETTLIDLGAEVKSYPIAERGIMDSKDVSILLTKATGTIKAEAHFKDFTNVKFAVNNAFIQPQTKITADNPTIGEILTKVFNSLPNITAEVSGEGKLPAPDLSVKSNLGDALEAGFKRELDAKVAELRKRLEDQVNGEIAKQKKQIEDQVNQLKAQVNGQVKRAQDQAQAEIKANQDKIDKAKKDGENQAKKQLGDQGQKTLDDLKKKFGL